jgi:hypothetical protein
MYASNKERRPLMAFIDVGDGSSAAPDLVPLSVSSGQTVVVNVLSTSGNSADVYQNGLDQPSTTVSIGSNLSLSVAGPFWVQATTGGGVCNIEITGGEYGTF